MIKGFMKTFDEVHAITCKGASQVPEGQKDFRPVPEMMTVFDLVFHMFSQEKANMVGCRTGKWPLLKVFRQVDLDKEQLHSMKELVEYGERIHQETVDWVESAEPEDLTRTVEWSLGRTTPEALLLDSLIHLVHHRGQLYAYLRLMGIEPVFVWTGEPLSVAREQLPEMEARESNL